MSSPPRSGQPAQASASEAMAARDELPDCDDNTQDRKSARPRALIRLLLLGLCLLGLLASAAYWSATSADVKQSLAELQTRAQALGPAWVLFMFTLALSLAVPLGLLALLVIAVLGPWLGFFTVLLGALISASISHLIGHRLGHQALQTLAGPRVRLLSLSLGARGLWAVITLRLVPLAPFAVANMVAGATHIRLRDLLLGTVLGMSSIILAMAFFMDWILARLHDPTDLVKAAPPWWVTLLSLVGLLLVLGMAWAWRRKKMKRRRAEAEAELEQR